ncbi:hypothetical protein KR200_004681, partial [Drosophila serrata]
EPSMENPREILPPPVLEGEMPTYFHVGVLAKLSLLDGYNNGVWRLQTTTRTENDLYLSGFGGGYPLITNACGGMEVLQEMGPYHASLCWLTDQEFLSDVGVQGVAFGGQWISVCKLGAANMADEWQFTGKLKCGFDLNPVKVELEIPIYRQPLFKGYLMLAPAKHFLLGYRTVFDLGVRKFGMHAFCMGFDYQTTEVALKLENFNQLRGSIFQRLGENWAFALKTDLYGNVGQKNFHIGCQYEWEPGSLIKAKITGDARLGFIYQRKLSKGIEVLFNCCFDGKDPLNGDIRLGAAWYFNV